MRVSVSVILLQHILVVEELGKRGILLLAIMIFPSARFRTHWLASRKSKPKMASAVIRSAMTNLCLYVIPEIVIGVQQILIC